MLRATSLTTAAITGGSITGTTTGLSGVAVKLGTVAVPVFSAPTGTMANNGAITLGTALDGVYGDCFLILPAGSVAAGVPAATTALYAQMSSTTVGTVFNNAYTTGEPTVPASPTAFATTGPGAYTGDTTEQGVIIAVPILNARARIYASLYMRNNNSAGAKTPRTRLNGAAGTLLASAGQTTVTDTIQEVWIYNVTQAKQRSMQQALSGSTKTLPGTVSATVDMSAATDIRLTVQKAVATDWVAIILGEVHYIQ